MIFSSPLFLFVYLPAFLALYYVMPNRARNYCALVFSYIFYGWGEPALAIRAIASLTANIRGT